MSLSPPLVDPGATLPESPPIHRRRLVALFAVYLVVLTWAVLWKLEVPFTAADRAVKLVPFVSVGVVGASAPPEVVANLLLFVPLGAYLALLAPSWPWWRAAAAVAAVSGALEAAQYVLGVGRSDVTDVLANTAGGLVGLLLVALTRRRVGDRTAEVLARACLLATVVVLVLAALYLAGPVRLVHVKDVGPLVTGQG